MKNDVLYQAKDDGTIEIGEQNSNLIDKELKGLFEDSATKGKWKLKFIKNENGLVEYILMNGSIIFELYVYLFNVRSSSRGRSKEQRIQLNSNISIEGFKYTNSKTKKCLLIGIYHYNNQYIFCTWPAETKNNHGKQKSCYISIETIAIAMRDGFAKRRDNAGDVVCAFRPEFIHYYLMNMKELHS